MAFSVFPGGCLGNDRCANRRTFVPSKGVSSRSPLDTKGSAPVLFADRSSGLFAVGVPLPLTTPVSREGAVSAGFVRRGFGCKALLRRRMEILFPCVNAPWGFPVIRREGVGRTSSHIDSSGVCPADCHQPGRFVQRVRGSNAGSTRIRIADDPLRAAVGRCNGVYRE